MGALPLLAHHPFRQDQPTPENVPMPHRQLWNVRCTAHRSDGQPCGAWSIRGGYVCRVHGGRAPQVRAAAEWRLWHAKVWGQAEGRLAQRLGALNERDLAQVQAETRAWLREGSNRLAKFRRINGRQPRGDEWRLITGL